MPDDIAASGGLDAYLPLVMLLALSFGFAVFSVAIAPLVGPKRFNKAKSEPYECGIEPSPQPVAGGGRIPVKFYLTGMLFILFDIEMVFLYPYAVAADAVGMFGFIAVTIFIVAITIPYVYEWARGGLEWD
ncbi:NADH-quinone oxidoreductase subunit A [Haloechinothrix halophila]|uniref:NADH-quinone oxidoreductase subunit A n=1 Tax=Haloechinothrix halophila YIM 93223 TaxID=592678 RepID=W9DNF4_9PSEU|nr:NADH-quinone oxidoreductase subunit A [Haloechinothrix halophila]ETA66488.1 NADH:ubiquinone oxidoreductase subunit 3 (chain A) [Haloechinothrix halophila YIM 93223]MPY78785.1 NADH-quinone oxidoreductase subunit A [Actinophytocola sp.]